MVYALFCGTGAFIVSLIAGRWVVAFLASRGLGKRISTDAPASHMVKAGTPTMGGLLIFGTVFLVTAATNLFEKMSIFLPLGIIVATGTLGLIDDFLTIEGRAKGHKGLNKRLKTTLLLGLGITSSLILYYGLEAQSINVPWAGKYNLGLAYIPLAVIVFQTTTTAVAITDGLDGLAGGTTALAFACFSVIAFLQDQLFLATFCLTVVGATLGFVWYNAHPARVFMGDTGALALGSTLAVVALMTGWWLLLPVVGVVFVLEGLSTFMQIVYFRLSGGKRIFKMTPLHHHFELMGWSEPQIVTRFWLIGMAGGLLGIALALTD